MRSQASFPQGNQLKLLTLSALLIALLAVFSQISLPLPVVPVNLALLAVFLIGFLLPVRQSMVVIGLYLLMGTFGLPVFAGFRGGPQALFGSTGGYLLGYLFSAAIISLLSERTNAFYQRFLLCLLALFLCYLPGTLWLMALTGRGLSQVLPVAVYPFVLGDLLKCLAAALLAAKLKAILQRI